MVYVDRGNNLRGGLRGIAHMPGGQIIEGGQRAADYTKIIKLQ